ncbi:MAG: domain protein beta Propeller [Ilumatobacteraceae bacterium]|nr:domain protein beta Propeller [Ilumatobacteraceae bacterium]
MASMHLNRRSCAALALTATAVLAPVLAAPASAYSTLSATVITRATDSTGAQYAGGTTAARVSADGQWLAFSRPGLSGSYVKSLVSGGTTLISVADDGQPANAASTVEGISADGDQILFATAATNMGQGAPTARDLYVHRISNHHTRRANFTGGTGSQVAAKAGESTLSDNGYYVVFATVTNHLWAQADGGYTEQIDVLGGGQMPNGTSGQPSVSPDARYVTFTSHASNLVANDNNFAPDVFERDRETGTTKRVSLSDTEVAPNSGSTESSVSGDGRYVAFTSDANNLVTDDTNNSRDVFLRDLAAGTTHRLSVKTGGAQANGESSHPDLYAAATFVAFESTADNLASVANNAKTDVYLREISGNLTNQIGNDGYTNTDQGATGASLASNGTVGFTSTSTNLIAGDTNGAADAFAQGYQPLGPFPGFGPLAARMRTDFGLTSNDAAVQADLDNGRLTPGHLIARSAHDPAWAQHREPVARLYQAFFHRVPDLNGLNFWVKKRVGGTKLSVIAASFAGSSEFKTAYGNVDNTGFVTLVYGNVLQRKPDTAGLDHWVNKMAGGMSRGDVMVAFSESSEGRRFLAPEVDATLMGLGMLHAMPSKALWKQVGDADRDHAGPEWGALVLLSSADYVNLVVK